MDLLNYIVFLISEALFFMLCEAEGILLTRGHNKERRHRAAEGSAAGWSHSQCFRALNLMQQEWK